MKRTIWKNWMKLAAMLTLAAMVAVSCKKDEDDNNNNLVEDGIYLSGSATGYTGLHLYAMMQDGRVEGAEFSSNPREGMFEKLMYLTTGDLKITEKAGTQETVYGVESAPTEFTPIGGDNVQGPIYVATASVGGAAISITEAGFYHVVMDKPTNKIYFVKITKWGVIGDATELGWSGQYDMEPDGISATECKWKAEDVIIRERGGFKFRYNNGWKIGTEDFIIFGNIGKGTSDNDYIMGGGTWAYPTTGEGKYRIILIWKPNTGWSFTTEKTGNVDPLPEYPENVYMIGSAVGGWNWDEINLPMIPVHSKPWLFWRIQWLEGGQEFKFSPVRAWNGEFTGANGENGVYEIATSGGNITAPAESGYYMIVVNFQTNKIAVTTPKVYLIGNTVGSWDTANENALFTVDNANDVVTITKELAEGELRMYAWFTHVEGWFTDWWQSEFIILNNEIVFRGNGPDQERVNVIARNYKIDLNFKTGAGSITAQ